MYKSLFVCVLSAGDRYLKCYLLAPSHTAHSYLYGAHCVSHKPGLIGLCLVKLFSDRKQVATWGAMRKLSDSLLRLPSLLTLSKRWFHRMDCSSIYLPCTAVALSVLPGIEAVGSSSINLSDHYEQCVFINVKCVQCLAQ